MPDITMDEWRAELEAAGIIGDGDAGQTARELSKAMGVDLRRMRTILADGVAAGRYVRGRSYRVNKSGTRRPVPVYRIASKTKRPTRRKP